MTKSFPKLTMTRCFDYAFLLFNLSHTVSASPLCFGRQLSVPNFEKERSEKNECLGGHKEFLLQIFVLGGRGEEEGGKLRMLFVSKQTL